MKTNWLIIIALSAIVGFTQVEMQQNSEPSIHFSQIDQHIGEKNSSIYNYKIQLRSKELLKEFEIIPSIKGANIDSQFNYEFENPSHQAVINYFYVLPDGIKDRENVSITFILRDSKNEKYVVETIFLTDKAHNINFAKL